MNGGKSAIRGFVYQTFIALLSFLQDDSWTLFCVEPHTNLDKVDILLQGKKGIKAIQVKSSINNFTTREINKWLTDLVSDCPDAEYFELVLVGNCEQKTNKYIRSVNENKAAGLPEPLLPYKTRLNIELTVFNTDTMLSAIQDKLNGFLHQNQRQISYPDLKLLAAGCIKDVFILSTGGKKLPRKDFTKSVLSSVETLMRSEGLLLLRIETTKLPITSPELFGREEQLAMLDQAWGNPHTRVLSFIAAGGVGKSALVNAWLNTMEADNYRGAEYVYGWSFYSQGVTEQTQASADSFFNDCLTWSGYVGKPPDSQVEKGKLLVRILAPKRCLLLLDGLEPLQYAPGPMYGRLKDQAMQVLLKGLSRSFAGLCVITSRCEVEDIKTTQGRTTFTCNLENLDKDAGKRLLESYGIKGPEKELLDTSNEFKGHALALHLLGSYLKTVHSGDNRKRDKIPALVKDEKYGSHTKRVMGSYEIWFKKENKPELDVLYLMGLFDKPVTTEAIDVLKKKPVIPGLTEKFVNIPYDNWQIILSHLQELRLISISGPTELDCHPLVREYFGEKLMLEQPEVWRQAHKCLYDYYKNLPAKEYPDTINEMEPLFAAVRHGCLAGKHQEVLEDVFWERILRKKNGYIFNQLGAFGDYLTCMSYFFKIQWHKPAFGLIQTAKAGILGWVGFALRAMGRLREALEPMKSGMEIRKKDRLWVNVAAAANNISELLLTLGDLKLAQEYGNQSIEYAEKSGDTYWIVGSRTTLADAFFQGGETELAENLFLETEEIQKKRQPANPYLYSLQGFRYCDLLFSQGKYIEVFERAKKTLENMQKAQAPLLTIALDSLSIGKALLYQAIHKTNPDVSEAEKCLCRGVEGLRKAGTQDRLPLGLIARAALYRYKQQFALSWEDLEEAREIAHYGSMKLHLTDYYLEACRNVKEVIGIRGKGPGKASQEWCFIIEEGEKVELSVDGMKEKFRKFLREAERLLGETRYHRRDGELAELKKWTEDAVW